MSDARDAALEWLTPRLANVPDPLRSKVLAAVQRTTTSSSPADVFQAAADGLLEETLGGAPASDAVALLAADALITYVCEYTSIHATESLSQLK